MFEQPDDNYVQIPEPVSTLEIEENKEAEPKINQKHLLLVTVSCSLNSMQLGGVLSASGQNFTQLNEQLKWTKKEKQLNITLISTICIFGMVIGCILSGKLFRFGKRRVIMLFQILCVIGCVLSFASLNFVIILVGRFIVGFSAGVFISMCPVIIEETVPGKLMDNGYGSSTNISINTMVCINMVLGLLVPQK